MQELLTKIGNDTKRVSPSIEVLSYVSYPKIMLSDHKPVAALLSVVFPSSQGTKELEMQPVKPIWMKGKSLKILLKFKDFGKSSPTSCGHWVGLYECDLVRRYR